MKASEKKSRPLSATRRMKPKDKLDNNAEEIFKAMAEENQTIGERLWCGNRAKAHLWAPVSTAQTN